MARAKRKNGTKIKLKSRSEWIEIFSGSDACVSPVLSMEEAQEHPHNKKEKLSSILMGLISPMLHRDTLKPIQKLNITPKEIGSDLDDICNEFNLLKNYFQ